MIVLIHLKIWPKIWKLGSLFCRKTIFYPEKIFLPVFSLQTVGVVQSGSIVHAPSEFGQEKASHGKCPLTGHWSWGDVHQNLLANTSPWQGQGKGWIFLWLQMNVLFSIRARRESQKLSLKVFFWFARLLKYNSSGWGKKFIKVSGEICGSKVSDWQVIFKNLATLRGFLIIH